MLKVFFTFGAVSAGFAVAAGAFGAHALKARLTPEMLAVFEVGVRYQVYHAFALLVTAWAISRGTSSLLTTGGWLFIIGTLLFSGSLYILSISGSKPLGMITPIGGVAFLAGWACLAIGIWKN